MEVPVPAYLVVKPAIWRRFGDHSILRDRVIFALLLASFSVIFALFLRFYDLEVARV